MADALEKKIIPFILMPNWPPLSLFLQAASMQYVEWHNGKIATLKLFVKLTPQPFHRKREQKVKKKYFY